MSALHLTLSERTARASRPQPFGMTDRRIDRDRTQVVNLCTKRTLSVVYKTKSKRNNTSSFVIHRLAGHNETGR